MAYHKQVNGVIITMKNSYGTLPRHINKNISILLNQTMLHFHTSKSIIALVKPSCPKSDRRSFLSKLTPILYFRRVQSELHKFLKDGPRRKLASSRTSLGFALLIWSFDQLWIEVYALRYLDDPIWKFRYS